MAGPRCQLLQSLTRSRSQCSAARSLGLTRAFASKASSSGPPILPSRLLATPRSSWSKLEATYHDWLVHTGRHEPADPANGPTTKSLAGLRLYTQTGQKEAEALLGELDAGDGQGSVLVEAIPEDPTTEPGKIVPGSIASPNGDGSGLQLRLNVAREEWLQASAFGDRVLETFDMHDVGRSQ